MTAVLAFAARWWWPLMVVGVITGLAVWSWRRGHRIFAQTVHEDQALALTKAPAPPRSPRGTVPGHRLKCVVKTWECGCNEVWKGPKNVTRFPCPTHVLWTLEDEIKDLLS